MILRGPHHVCELTLNGSTIILLGESHSNSNMCDNSESIVGYLDGCNKTHVYLEMPVKYKTKEPNLVCNYESKDVLNAVRTCLYMKKVQQKRNNIHFTDIRPFLGHLLLVKEEPFLKHSQFDAAFFTSKFLNPLLKTHYIERFLVPKCLEIWRNCDFIRQMQLAIKKQDSELCVITYRSATDKIFELYTISRIIHYSHLSQKHVFYGGSFHTMQILPVLQELGATLVRAPVLSESISCVSLTE